MNREKIIAEARTWIGTPFHHQGRLKGKGCDCLGLLIGIAKELDLKNCEGENLDNFDDRSYSRIPDGEKLKARLGSVLREVERFDRADVVLFRFGNNPQHLALVSDYQDGQGLIHCYRDAGKVVEHRLDDFWARKIVSSYSFF